MQKDKAISPIYQTNSSIFPGISGLEKNALKIPAQQNPANQK